MTKIERGRFTISANIIMTASLITRTLSFGFVMMSIYIKVGDDILDDDVIKIVNIQKVGGMPLGTTVQCIVFSLIGVFAVEMVTGIFGIWGAIGRKNTMLALSVLMSSFLIMVYGIYIVLLAIVYHQKSNLNDKVSQYTNAYLGGTKYISSDYYYDTFPAFLSKLGCGTSNPQIYQCVDVYDEQLESYLETYFGLITTCIVCQVFSIVAVEYTYRKIEFKEKKHSLSDNKYYLLLSLQHGIARNSILFLKNIWNRSRIVFASVFLKIMSLIAGLGLLGLGLTLVGDEYITDGSLKYIFYKIMMYQYYFYDILVGMAASAIVIGILTIVLSILGIVGSWRKSPYLILTSSLLSFVLHVARMIVVILWSIFVDETNDSLRPEMKTQQDGYLYSNNVYTLTPYWNDMLLRLQCCGVYSPYDTSGTTYGYWFCCNNIDETRISSSSRYASSENILDYFGGCGGFKSDTCSEKILFKTRMFVGWFIAVLLLQIILEIVGIFFANKEYGEIVSSQKADGDTPTKTRSPVTLRVVWDGIKEFFIRHWTRTKLSLVFFICLGTICILSFPLLVLAINIRYDKIFGNSDIDDLLDEVSLHDINLSKALKNFSTVVATFSVVTIAVVIYSVVILVPVKRMKILLCLNLGFIVMVSVASITQIGLWGKYMSDIQSKVKDELQTELYSYRYSHTSGIYDWTNSLSWNTLFIKGKCCGIGTGASNIASSFTSSSWYGSRDSTSQVVPVQCCKSETSVYPYNSRYDSTCTYNVNSGLFHTDGCDEVITTRLNAYSIPFFVFTAIKFIAEIVCIVILVFEIIGGHTDESISHVHVKVKEDKIEVTEIETKETAKIKTTGEDSKGVQIKKPKKDKSKSDSKIFPLGEGQKSVEKVKRRQDGERTGTKINVETPNVSSTNTSTEHELKSETLEDEAVDIESSQKDKAENIVSII